MDVIVRTSSKSAYTGILGFVSKVLTPVSAGIGILSTDIIADVDGIWRLEYLDGTICGDRWKLSVDDHYAVKILIDLIAWESLDFT